MKIAFCGHGDIAPSESGVLSEKICKTVIELIKGGAREFLLGGYGAFDNLCAKIVYDLKDEYPHIKSVLVIPYLDREYNMRLYDISEYPPINVPRRFAILKRNEYMVEQADVVVAWVKYGFGGASKTYEYAKRKKKRIINLAEE